MKIRPHVVRGALVALLVGAMIGVPSTAVAAGESARAVVVHLDQALVATMKHADSLGFAGRYKKLAPVIDQAFDLPFISRLALGPAWSKLDSRQQQQYRKMFRQDTLATYAERFDGYDGQQIKVTKVKDAPGGRKKVDTEIVARNGHATPISYVLQNADGRWQIVNVVARGVSDLALKRGQYSSVIRSRGADGFIRQFERQLQKYPALPNV